MPLPIDRLCGLAGSLLILVGPARDQILRHWNWASGRRARKSGATGRYWQSISSAYEAKRNAWNFWDSATMAVGAILLALSYLLE